MTEEIRVLKEILDNEDLDNYTIDDDECYLNGYARRCLKKVLEELERLQDMDKILRNENINLKLRINKAIEYIENEDIDVCTIRYNNIQDVKQELLEILKGSDKE